MSVVRDLDQIEYRHHPTRDFSPMATSMSLESLNAWQHQITAWARHPHDERLSESACYQVLPDGTAALAWRYWDERVAERPDGSRGRPLVSRVLTSLTGVLSPEAAIALARTGPTAGLTGVLPGDVRDGMVLPTVSGAAVAALVDELAPGLDQAAMRENGLQAFVAAALSDASFPLAVILRDDLIDRPLRRCVQCTLLWGLLRVTGPIFGQVARRWSFSTFEPPLGVGDPGNLPGIVFRRAQDAPTAPPQAWRKELRVRLHAQDALAPAGPWADTVELAGWLVAEYRERGGDGLEQFISRCCGAERSVPARIGMVFDALNAKAAKVTPSAPPSSGMTQRADAGRDAHVAGRDLSIVYQYFDLRSEAGALGMLSASEGAKLLAELSRAQETLNRARNVVTGVSPSVAVPALKVLRERDEDSVIALLATINEAKAAKLVTAMGPDGTSLVQLPEATEAVTRCETTAYKSLGEPVGRFMRAVSPRGTRGFLQRYANGAIYWSPLVGALATTGAIARYHRDAGGSEGLLGFPVAPEDQGKHPFTGTECTWQLFEGPSDYNPAACDFLGVQCGGSVISTNGHGTYAISGAIGEVAELDWRDSAGLGLPVDDAIPIGPSQRAGEAGTSGWRQRFESGTVYFSGKTGAVRVPLRWAEYVENRGDAVGSIGFPVSPALDAAPSPYGTTGYLQRFEGAWDYPEDIVSCWSDQERPGGATIYHSDQHGARIVERGNGEVYERVNGTASWLGFPMSDEVRVEEPADDPGRTIQRFEGGAIFYTRTFGPVPVKREVLDYIAEQLYPDERLGFPIEEAQSLGSGDDDCIQFFEHGVVTVRDRLIQAWLDPAKHL
jgi:uncharacterized protein with LGFP repeats